MAGQPNATVGAPIAAGRPARRWRRTIAMSMIGGLVAFGLSGGLTQSGPWSARIKLLAICLIYGHCIGLAAAFALPSWLKRFGRQNRVSWWAARAMALPIVCAVGGAAAVAILMPFGLLPKQPYLAYLFPYFRWGPGPAVVAAIFFSVTGYEYLRNRLDATTLALRTKERDEAEARRLAAEAQLASLESRVQPHFLFNTLNSIAALIPQDPAGAEKMTGQLASLLRSSLDSSSSGLVRLEQEIKTVRDYLDIERVRFGDRLRFRLEVDDRANDCLIPKLSLQTLVENSVKYAVAPRREGGTIVVRAITAGAGVRLEVSDDGPGFEHGGMPSGHGLSLLRDRLQMTLGERARLTIESRPGSTTIVIDISDCRFQISD